MRYLWLCVFLALASWGCGSNADDPDVLEMRTVTLPGGQKIRAEVKIKPLEMQRGMMFRDSLPEGEGMLFIHPQPNRYSYWMYNVRIPLDIVWMDAGRRIVEISANTPPCRTRASECPTYGGNAHAQYVLEIGGGEAARYGLKVGDVLTF